MRELKSVKLTGEDLLKLNQGLEDSKKYKGRSFQYCVIRNKKHITDEVDTILEVLKPSDEILKYDKLRNDLSILYSKKDKNNNPVTESREGNTFLSLEEDKIEEFGIKLKELEEEHKSTLSDRETQIEENNKLLKSEVEINIFLITEEELPEDIDGLDLEKIEKMLE